MRIKNKFNSIFYFSILIVCGFFLVTCKAKKNLYLHLNAVDGLTIGAPVVSRGVKIGYVENFNLSNSSVITKLHLDEEYRIPKGSTFNVVYDNFLSGKLGIEVTFSNSTTFYNEKDTVVVNNLKANEKNNVTPIYLDSTSSQKVIEVFEKIDSIIGILKR